MCARARSAGLGTQYAVSVQHEQMVAEAGRGYKIPSFPMVGDLHLICISSHLLNIYLLLEYLGLNFSQPMVG